ncbi:sugar transferase [Mucilaginibacter sp.]|jgi:undecaprenyl phosphate N,N'-diacetylbacillosamine 1-phosphate transferase|uniref:sugar transferase n=1 Tax=Mucilaginibacter sp. TaxID=1882438 RepID=UPI00261F6D10|nr:sugar transferase [Mucilaginibacter sp.]MDB5126779.1 Undecaprenyl phosphate N-2CN-diacetylbacillosamine 1-phosphate transferase [Mucilaginibacter sp.]
MYRAAFKRLIDVMASFILLLILWPIMLLVYILLWLVYKEKPLFYQKRIGLHNKSFHLIKFRSMTSQKNEDGELLPEKMRLTRLGLFLRKSSLDELPQLFNILSGDMSLIGPRPLYERYLPYYTNEEQVRHSVRPGISGWAQVNGRNAISWDTKLALDVFYVKHLSFKLDCLIAYKTIINILTAKNILADETSTVKYLDKERPYQSTNNY